MSVRDELVKALENNNEPTLRRLGWWPVWEAAATWWAPRQTCSARELVPYAKLLGDEAPDTVLEAFRELAGDWRPHPSAVRAFIHRNDADPSKVDVGRAHDRAGTAQAFAAVAEAIHAGESPCTCDRHRSQWRRDCRWVLRCVECSGLEPGQVYAAEDADLMEPAA